LGDLEALKECLHDNVNTGHKEALLLHNKACPHIMAYTTEAIQELKFELPHPLT
jgi:hypothetical protein